MPQFVRLDAPDADALRASFEQYEANERVLAEKWSDLLALHQGKWVAAFDRGTTVVRASLAELLEVVPTEQRLSAVVRFVAEIARPRLL